MPMRNEEEYISESLGSLLQQTYPRDSYEILVVDGRSTDRSPEIVRQLQSSHPQIRLLDNAAAIVPTGMNLGIRQAKGEIIIRADAHTIYPPEYIQDSVTCLNKTGADNVGGPWITLPRSDEFGARVVAAILTNRFGVGNSSFRISSREGFVDTVPFGAFRKELFQRVGLFNEALVRNQDNDLNARIRNAGGKIYMARALATRYMPPRTLGALLGKTYRESKWHVFTIKENASAMGARHLVPAFFVLTLLTLAAFSVVNTYAAFALIAVLALYFLPAIYFSLTASGAPMRVRVALPIAFFLFHLWYGMGTLAGLRYAFVAPEKRPLRL
jgi:glycosyltransferase involved in cell wall biosynthesis